MAGNPAWKKGVSGNPGGRPKEVVEVVALARANTYAAMKVLLKFAFDEKATWQCRQAAINSIFDRAIGKPKQAINLDITEGPAVPIINVTLIEPDGLDRAKLIAASQASDRAKH